MGNVFSNSFAGKNEEMHFLSMVLFGLLSFLYNCHLIRPNVVACSDIALEETSRFDSNSISEIAHKKFDHFKLSLAFNKKDIWLECSLFFTPSI